MSWSSNTQIDTIVQRLVGQTPKMKQLIGQGAWLVGPLNEPEALQYCYRPLAVWLATTQDTNLLQALNREPIGNCTFCFYQHNFLDYNRKEVVAWIHAPLGMGK